jgi:hypothetical protein
MSWSDLRRKRELGVHFFGNALERKVRPVSVSVSDRGWLKWPFDLQGRIVERQATFMTCFMERVHRVGDVCRAFKCDETVCQARWNVQRNAILCAQFDGVMPKESWRLGAQVDDNVKDGPSSAPDQLGFGYRWEPEVHATEGPATRVVRNACLNELTDEAIGAELAAAKRSFEMPSIINMAFRFDQVDTVER